MVSKLPESLASVNSNLFGLVIKLSSTPTPSSRALIRVFENDKRFRGFGKTIKPIVQGSHKSVSLKVLSRRMMANN